MLVSQDDQVKAYIKKIMSQLNKWMLKSKISKLIIVITSKETGEPVERWQFDVGNTLSLFPYHSELIITRCKYSAKNQKRKDPARPSMKTLIDQDVQQEIQSIFRQITASVTFLPMLDGNCTFNVLVYADQDSEVPLEWGDSDAKDIQDAEKVQLRSFSTNNHKVDTLIGGMNVEKRRLPKQKARFGLRALSILTSSASFLVKR
ncbi:mitotic spindle checkpoint component mad2 [Aureobasidium pullulans]|uniref:Mitotic spindle checkpoint component mad2 n=1 Tax=Aureobasidium pullulans TaxID=5580 RepID=A0A4S8RY96_AURPU|nr:mitotic spindle checkpoint component mad2 [Aureobasidium pullulans]